MVFPRIEFIKKAFFSSDNMSFKTFFYVYKFLKNQINLLMIAIIAGAVYGAIDGLLVKLIKDLLDEGFVAKNEYFARQLPQTLCLIFIVRSLCSFISQYFCSKATQSAVLELRRTLFTRLLYLPSAIMEKKSPGEFINTLMANTQLMASSMCEILMVLVREGISVIVLIVVMISANLYFTMIYLSFIPLSVFILSKVAQKSRLMNKAVNHANELITAHLHEIINGHHVLKAFSGYHMEQLKFHKNSQQNFFCEIKQSHAISMGASLVQLIAGLSLTLIVSLSMNTPHGPALSAGDFTCLVTAILAMFRPLKQLTRVHGLWQKTHVAALNLLNFEEYPQEQISLHTHLPSIVENIEPDHIEFRNVSFEYYQGQMSETLSDICFNVEPGQTLAIVGPSGGGKSTVVSLLMRLYETKGSIFINNRDIRDFDLVQLRDRIAVVSQQITLFDDSVAANIAYGHQDIDEARVIAAAKLAHAHEFICDLPHGYFTHIGSNGSILSGGQRQRLALARAFYKNAPILILDEATSALDPESEDKIQQAVVSLMKRATTIVIAHRLSTIIHADKIVVIERGQIVEQGTHEKLIQAQGVYYHLYRDYFYEESKVT